MLTYTPFIGRIYESKPIYMSRDGKKDQETKKGAKDKICHLARLQIKRIRIQKAYTLAKRPREESLGIDNKDDFLREKLKY